MKMLKLKRWMRGAARLMFQLLILAATWLVADALARHWGSKIPGAVWGLGALLTVLWCGILPSASVATGARWLLAEMLLFFVPLCVEVAGYMDLFAREGVRLVAAILLGTVMVMAGTAWVVEQVYHWETAWNTARKSREEQP